MGFFIMHPAYVKSFWQLCVFYGTGAILVRPAVSRSRGPQSLLRLLAV